MALIREASQHNTLTTTIDTVCIHRYMCIHTGCSHINLNIEIDIHGNLYYDEAILQRKSSYSVCMH